MKTKRREDQKVTASIGILGALLWLSGLIQCVLEEDYQAEGAYAHFIINYCDSAEFRGLIHTSRVILNIGKISKCSRMRKNALKRKIYRLHFSPLYTTETVEKEFSHLT